MTTIPYFENHFKSAIRGIETPIYSLKEIAAYLHIDAESTISVIKQEYNNVNDQFAKRCMEAIIQKARLSSYYVEANCEVTGMRDLPQLCSSSIERPDIIVYTNLSKQQIVLIGEIKSSPYMLYTERKASIGAANLLRLLRSSNYNIKSITTFALPNLQSKECIVEIKITWEDYKFISELTRHRTIPSGIDRIIAVMKQQHENLPALVSKHLMKLSNEECNALCKSSPSVQIVSSRHIMMKANGKVYKILYCPSETKAFYLYYHKKKSHCTSIIHPEIEREGSRLVYSYNLVPYSPLNAREAKTCLRSLVQGIKTALDEVHGLELSHNDIRLPNICFNSSFKVILIDFDRCHEIDKLYPMFLSHSGVESCMYDKRAMPRIEHGRQTDYFQLGWLVAWIMDSSGGDYHDRNWIHEGESIQNNRFINHLVLEGEYHSEFLVDLPNDKSLEECIKRRN